MLISDTNGGRYYGKTCNGAAQSPTAFPLLPSAIDANPHIFMMFMDSNNRIVFQMDGSNLRDITSNLPGANQPLGFYMQITRTDLNNTRDLVFYDAWCEFDA